MSKHLDSLTGQLHENGSLKVWSLIITFFGDSIVNRGGNVSANTVHTVLDKIDIGSGAVRTAFSRLARDGWVERQKLGRRNYYQLTDQGMSLFSNAAKRIYSPIEPANSQKNSETWLLGVHVKKSVLDHFPIANAVVLPNRSVLVFNPDKKAIKTFAELDILSVSGKLNAVPAWVVAQVRPVDWEDQMHALQTGFANIANNPPSDPLSALAARTLLIHQWRRLLLRYPPIPNALKGQSLQLEKDGRQFVAVLYHDLSRLAESWLNEQGTCMTGTLPNARTNVADRFTRYY